MSHSSTEAEIISLDAGLRMDGIPSLDLWISKRKYYIQIQKSKTKAQARTEKPVS